MRSRWGRPRAGVVAISVFGIAFTGGPARALDRGDVDRNGSREITDAVNILSFLFLGGTPPSCKPLADVTGEGDVDISDPVALLSHLFLGGAVPPPLKPLEVEDCKGLDRASVLRGMAIYEADDSAANPRATPFACATCHEVIPDDQSPVLRAGHSLYDALRRPSFKDQKIANFLGATNVCRIDWMNTKPYVESDQAFKDLVAYIEGNAPDGARPALLYEIQCTPRTGPPAPGSNAEKGCKLFAKSCASCHGADANGSDLAVSLLDPTVPILDDPDYVRTRIRKSGPSTVDRPDVPYPCLVGRSRMPFWTPDLISDGETEDLVNFVLAARQAASTGGAFDCSEPPPSPPDGRPTRVAGLSTLLHEVSGNVEEFAVRKIVLLNFNYDSKGAQARVWLYRQAGRIEDGRAIGPDLRRATRYTDATVVVDIPAEVSFDSYDSVAIWCEPYAVDFGHGRLSPVP
jgi:thiosulfate dehydrogenase